MLVCDGSGVVRDLGWPPFELGKVDKQQRFPAAAVCPVPSA
eukprot:COSAG03_NODE_544_length_7025_cov_8.435894_9_plen_41_part_00